MGICEPFRASGHGTPNQISTERVRDDKKVSNPGRATNGVSEDVEHVVAVIGEGEGMDDGIILDDEDGQKGGGKEVERPQELRLEEE